MGTIFQTLAGLGLTSEETREVFAERTRDRDPLTVWRDRRSGVIYIDDHYVGDAVYESGAYRVEETALFEAPTYEDAADTARRVADYRRHYAGRAVRDLGCGAGAFVRAIRGVAASVGAVELEEAPRRALTADGIPCGRRLSEVAAAGGLDTVFAFHSLEHMPDPLAVLREAHAALRVGGLMVVEVPHARDLLLAGLDCAPFRAFTLWSQHLILHTRESLDRLLTAAGFSPVVIEGRQRYPLSNHLQWLSKGTPGGHKGLLSTLDTDMLVQAYEAALQKVDGTDTLVAIAERAPDPDLG